VSVGSGVEGAVSGELTVDVGVAVGTGAAVGGSVGMTVGVGQGSGVRQTGFPERHCREYGELLLRYHSFLLGRERSKT
jgi:hypothetical protein